MPLDTPYEWPDEAAPSRLLSVTELAGVVRMVLRGPRVRQGGRQPAFRRRALVINFAETDAFLSFNPSNLRKLVGAVGPEVFVLPPDTPIYLYAQTDQEVHATGGPANPLRLSVHAWDEAGPSQNGVPE